MSVTFSRYDIPALTDDGQWSFMDYQAFYNFFYINCNFAETINPTPTLAGLRLEAVIKANVQQQIQNMY